MRMSVSLGPQACDIDESRVGELKVKKKQSTEATLPVALSVAFENACRHVLETTSCPNLDAISNGWCEIWAKAVKRSFPAVEVREKWGHWFVIYRGVAYDSDTWSDGGFSAPD
jgi:hypothetical protein